METSVTQPESIEINQKDIDTYMEKIQTEQKLWLAIIGGIGVWLIGSILWATITVVTWYQVGYMALFIWLWVGYAFRYLGKWTDKIFGVMSALIAFLSCIVGNILTILVYVSQIQGISYIDAIAAVDWLMLPEVLISTFDPIDFIFYGLAIYTGYKSAFHVISHDDVIMNIKK